ncbi:hypothetical protein M9458_035111, partial [Cirrhinus mrigala]
PRLQPSPVKEIQRNSSSQEGLANPSSSLMSATLSPKPLSPSNQLETNPVKRVRKLKKRKCLNKAKLNEQPEISESELDAEPIPRPTRKCRPHRRSSSTYVSPTAPEEKEENEEMMLTEASKAQPQETKLTTPPEKEEHSESSELEMVELPPPDIDIVNLDSSDADEMPEKKAKESATTDHGVTDPQNLACNEVTST